ncbi:MAG TPA: NAD-dependent epimerase/dehydratase family protein [Thermoguttaceae bacterium]|nr:NAD-dependent epimerase/dehydratase family protein [Thermoguttaceae bacterium]
MSHRALITGVSGFVGGFLAEHLLECGDAVLGCSPDGKWEPTSPEELRDRVELVGWNIGDPEGLSLESRRRIECFRPDCVYHLAALSVPQDCGQDEPLPRAVAVNVDGTRRVMELVASLPSRPRVLFTSSSHVYAPVSPQSPKIDETAPLAPRRGYGRTKLAAESEVRRAVEQAGCDAVIARSFQHTGPQQNPRMMLPEWTRQFATGGSEPVKVFTRDARIDLTDVRDVVRAYKLLMERGERGEIYNVGSGVSRRSGDVLDVLRTMADPKRPIEELHPGFKQDPIADITRLVRCTGWRARVSLETTVADTLAWWRSAGG